MMDARKKDNKMKKKKALHPAVAVPQKIKFTKEEQELVVVAKEAPLSKSTGLTQLVDKVKTSYSVKTNKKVKRNKDSATAGDTENIADLEKKPEVVQSHNNEAEELETIDSIGADIKGKVGLTVDVKNSKKPSEKIEKAQNTLHRSDFKSKQQSNERKQKFSYSEYELTPRNERFDTSSPRKRNREPIDRNPSIDVESHPRKAKEIEEKASKKLKKEAETEVREEVVQCLLRLNDLIRRSNDEDKCTLVETVMVSIEGSEYAVIRNMKTSSVVQRMLPFCSLDLLMKFISCFSSKNKLKALISERHSCEFIEKICISLQKKLSMENERLIQRSVIVEFLEKLVEAVTESIAKLVDQFYCLFMLRAMLCLIVESSKFANVPKNEKGMKLRDNSSHGQGQVEIADIQKSFLSTFVDFLCTVHLQSYLENTQFSTLFQVVLHILDYCHMETKVVEIVTKHFFPLGEESSSDASTISQLCRNKFYSRVVETLVELENTPEVYKRIFEGIKKDLNELCADQIANHVIQKLMQNCRDKMMGRDLILSICPCVGDICAARNMGIIVNLCLLCKRYPKKQPMLFDCILEAYECTDLTVCFVLLSYLMTEPDYNAWKSNHKLPNFSYHASVLIQSLLEWGSQQVLETLSSSFAKSEPRFVSALARDRFMSHVLGKFFGSSSVKDFYKSEVMEKLVTEIKSVAPDTIGSRAIEDVFGNCSMALKKEMMEGLSKISREQLQSTQGGFILSNKLKVDLFTRNPEIWRQVISEKYGETVENKN